jgi:hypothetical protein
MSMIPRDGLGTILTVPELKYRLRHISRGDTKWRLKAVFNDNDGDSYAEISCYHPSLFGGNSKASYRFPLIATLAWDNAEPLVCLHPLLAIAAARGLYLHHGKWKHDELADFAVFWPPLREVL